MTENVIHYLLEPGQYMASTYCSTLVAPNTSGPDDHPKSFSARHAEQGAPLHVALYHGRDTTDEDMDDWGYSGPEFECLSVAHDPDVMLLQQCDPLSVQLAKRTGLMVHGDTVAIAYAKDGVLEIPAFRDNKPAYFGDFSIRATHTP